MVDSREDPATVLVFGGSGALGSAIVQRASARFRVLPVTRSAGELAPGWLSSAEPDWADRIPAGSLGGVVWAGGANCSNSLADGRDPFTAMFEANLLHIVDTLAELVRRDCLADGGSLVMLSSIWQEFSRTAKSAYIVSKSAVGGLVRAAAADLGPRGIRVNAVLPGVIDTPMTRANLSAEQIAGVAGSTPLGRLVTATEVAAVVAWLLGPGSSAVTGASIPVDGGWGQTHAV